MKHLKFIIAILFAGALVTTSCSKYEDGPKLSLLTKKSRLCGDWKIQSVSYTPNGGSETDITSFVNSAVGSAYEFQIEKDGNYKQTGNVNESGTWKFGEDKDDVTFTPSTAGSTADTYRILRLKSKELWLKETATDGSITITKLKQ